ncbi:hypothetical protein [sulfur-oxidizing endosymbiont of Gigantopelta aegis]|uniref:hypothetical protein n=1 Tax=sulfur-oxidizing endosymbiont of Gigantopelta aegis TaxID=2794934 RepID=UPI0018DC4DBB|nr:hypothetical protein [sulfur-oxidizing endosymbiont of Gigantopelta aegis]
MNSIDISVDFSFQGTHYTPVITIDLDLFVQQKEPTSFHRLIANQHQIDCYSYLYEVLESSSIIYCNPQGMAVEHIKDNYFDLAGYAQYARESKVADALLNIAQKEMGITDFSNNQALKNALLQAYELGSAQSL